MLGAEEEDGIVMMAPVLPLTSAQVAAVQVNVKEQVPPLPRILQWLTGHADCFCSVWFSTPA